MTQQFMQAPPLTTTMILRHGAAVHGSREIVSRLLEGGVHRYNYDGLLARSCKAAAALRKLGVEPTERVATLAWSTHRHLEAFYAVPGLGAILHTVNPRLHPDQIRFVLNEGGARHLLFDADMLPLVEQLAPQLRSMQTYVALTDPRHHIAGQVGARSYEQLLADEDGEFKWPELDEHAGACLCYTSGTTGNPKGVLYSHRSIVLEAMGASLNAAFGYRADDCVLPAASLYHAMGWAVPYTAPMNGVKLVLPGDSLDGAGLFELIETEGVTMSMGVPTIWTMFLEHLQSTGARPSTLKRLVIGGSAVPRNLAVSLGQHGIQITQGWGMTETSSLGVLSTPLPSLQELPSVAQQEHAWSNQGHPPFGVEIAVVDDTGTPVLRDGRTPGNLLIRGSWIIQRYYGVEEDATGLDGWFDTGDVVTIDRFGFIRITDRKKDLIKSGGEWISSIDLENIAASCPGVRAAAVVGVAHPKWEERPLLLVILEPNHTLTRSRILDYLRARLAKWWLPDDVLFVSQLPVTATGKFDKKELRNRYRDHLINLPPHDRDG